MGTAATRSARAAPGGGNRWRAWFRLSTLRGSGAASVTVGLLVLGLASYGFLTIGARGLSAAEFSVVAALWSVLFALANGLFGPLEQEATRAVAVRAARQESIGPVIRRIAALGFGLALALDLALLLARRPIAAAVFSGHTAVVAVLAVGLAAACGGFVTRGVLAGVRQFRGYACQIAGEGVLRVLVAAALVLAGSASVTGLGLAVTVPSVVVVIAAGLLLPRPQGRPRRSTWSEVTANLGWLMLAATFSQGVANAGPVVLQLMAGSDKGLAGRFLAAFVIVRIPLFFTSALQASLLPRLVAAVEARDRAAFGAALRAVLGLVAGLGALALAVFAAVGPEIVELLFGSRYPAERLDMVALGASSILLVLATILQSAVLAISEHRVVAGCWVLGGLAFLAGCLLPLDPVLRLDIAYPVSTGIVVVLLLVRLARYRAALRRPGAAPAHGPATAPAAPAP